MPHIILAHEDMKICPLVALGGYVGMLQTKEFVIHAGRGGMSSLLTLRNAGDTIDNEDEGDEGEIPDEPSSLDLEKLYV